MNAKTMKPGAHVDRAFAEHAAWKVKYEAAKAAAAKAAETAAAA